MYCEKMCRVHRGSREPDFIEGRMKWEILLCIDLPFLGPCRYGERRGVGNVVGKSTRF
jgi:hypothetical protein